jgi:hypothetical protein
MVIKLTQVKEAAFGVANVARPTGEVLTNGRRLPDLSVRLADLVASSE